MTQKNQTQNVESSDEMSPEMALIQGRLLAYHHVAYLFMFELIRQGLYDEATQNIEQALNSVDVILRQRLAGQTPVIAARNSHGSYVDALWSLALFAEASRELLHSDSSTSSAT